MDIGNSLLVYCRSFQGSMGCDQESLTRVWRWHQLLFGSLPNGRLSWVSRRLGWEMFPFPSYVYMFMVCVVSFNYKPKRKQYIECPTLRWKDQKILPEYDLLYMEPWAAAKKKKPLVSVAVPPAPVRLPSQRPLAPRQSRRSLIIRMIMKWSRGLYTDLLAFALQLRKTPEILS